MHVVVNVTDDHR